MPTTSRFATACVATATLAALTVPAAHAAASKKHTTHLVMTDKTVGKKVTFTAHLTHQGGGTPTGTVEFALQYSPIKSCKAVHLSSTGHARCTVHVASGKYLATASYRGNRTFKASAGYETLKVR